MSKIPLGSWINLKKLGLGLVVIGLVIGLYSCYFTVRVVVNLRHLELEKLAENLPRAQVFPKLVAQLTWHTWADVEIWRLGLQSLETGLETRATAQTYFQQIATATPGAPNTAQDLTQQLSDLATQLDQLDSYFAGCQSRPTSPRCWSVLRLVTARQFSDPLHTLAQATQDISNITQLLLSGNHRLLLLLQNSDELRASGGFMGSLVMAELDQGQLISNQFYDVYDPDGQLTKYMEPPTGVKQYLSEGRGWRLPDANWHPDFPTTSQTIAQFLAQTSYPQPDVIMALNLDLIEKLLAITGPIYLNDFGLTVTPQNLSAVARADRVQFFPGSKQKKFFLAHLATQLELKLTQFSPTQQFELIDLFKESSTNKDLQLYSSNPDLQAILTKHHLAGQLTLPENAELIYLLESNVGINKANQVVTRQVNIQVTPLTSLITLDFTHHQPDQPEADYINYQRLITDPSSHILNIKVNHHALTDWDEDTIINSQNQEFNQAGFLVPLAAGQSTQVQIEVSHPKNHIPPSQLQIIKQPGLAATPYQVEYNGQTQTLTLAQDTWLDLKK